MNEGQQQKGSALLMVISVILIITALLFATESLLNVKRVVVRRFLLEEELRRSGEELFFTVLHWLRATDREYDTPNEKVFPAEVLAEAGYPGARVEIWDEGSRFNPDNAPKALIDEFFSTTPRLRQVITEELFGWSAGPAETLARKKYFLTGTELEALGKTEEELTLLHECTLFGPAAFYLLDGEVFLSLLYRAGEDLTVTEEQRIINTFNEKRNTFLYSTDLTGLLSSLQLEILPQPEVMEELVTAAGIVNPNYASRRYVETVLSWLFGRVELYDFDEYRVVNPFTDQESFVNYLNMVYNREISPEKVWSCFSLKTRIWGVRIILPVEEGGKELKISAVIHRVPGRDQSDFFFKVLSFQTDLSSGL